MIRHAFASESPTTGARFPPYTELQCQRVVLLVCRDISGVYRSEVASTEMMRFTIAERKYQTSFFIEQLTVDIVTHATYCKRSVSGICGELEEEPEFPFRIFGIINK